MTHSSKVLFLLSSCFFFVDAGECCDDLGCYRQVIAQQQEVITLLSEKLKNHSIVNVSLFDLSIQQRKMLQALFGRTQELVVRGQDLEDGYYADQQKWKNYLQQFDEFVTTIKEQLGSNNDMLGQLLKDFSEQIWMERLDYVRWHELAEKFCKEVN